MRITFTCVVAGTIAVSSLAQNTNLNLAAGSASSTNKAESVIKLSLSDAQIRAPLALTNGCLSQPDTTDLEGGGKATLNFAITNAGTFVIEAMVNAPADDSNSFYINVDADPEDPASIWDVDVTEGFERRTASWRGGSDAGNDEFSPKKFKLSAGSHKLIIVGREPAQLKDLAIRAAE